MTDAEYFELQEHYGGQYVARRDAEVIASAATYEELSERLKTTDLGWTEFVIEYIEPVDRIRAY